MEAESTPQQAEARLHFLDYWRIIRIRKMVILLVFLLVVITTTAVTYMLPKTYMSSVRIDVQRDAADVALLGTVNTSQAYDPFFIQTQFERLQSSSVLDKVITELRLSQIWAERYGAPPPLPDQDTLKILKKRIDVRQVRNTSLIEIRVYSESPAEAKQISQRIAEIYRDNRMDTVMNLSQKGIDAIKKKFEAQNEKVEQLQKKLDELRKTSDITDLTPEGVTQLITLDGDTVRHSEQLRIEVNAQFVEKDKKLAELKKLSNEKRRTAIQYVRPDEHLSMLLQRLSATEQEILVKGKDFGPEHAEMVSLKSLLAKLNGQIDEKVEALMDSIESEVNSFRAKNETLASAVETAKKRMQEMIEKSRDYQLVKRDLEDAKSVRATLDLKVTQEDVNRNIGRTLIMDVTDAAKEALKPVRPNIPLNIALGVVVGLMLGIGLAFFIEYLDTSVKTIDDIERALQAPVIGVVPQNVGVLIEEGVESPHAEAYRVLRTNVLFSRKDQSRNAITVVSGGAGEGKSTTVLNLATVFAQNGQRVLLVDSDLRRPSLHKRLGLSNSTGLTSFLLGQKKLEEVIQTTAQAGLDFLPSGKLPSSSLGILNSPQMRDFVKDIKRRYDIVFFDAPPILGVSDASVLVSEMDFTILVVQYRKYPQALTARAKQMIDKVGGTLLGVVLNNINISQDAYYYYYSGYENYSRVQDDEDEPAEKGGGESEKAQPALKQKY
ncbi:MAG: polysaccharide biosynthesis tyrosine autokinase [Verrucomicrobia bacterium]|nr:polysaccharide biosynthesis tyrosine autokinase [Verrucomicrobiota bacterium]